jgi:hypothetical protein
MAGSERPFPDRPCASLSRHSLPAAADFASFLICVIAKPQFGLRLISAFPFSLISLISRLKFPVSAFPLSAFQSPRLFFAPIFAFSWQ